jgi:hypothetical protein
MVIWKLGGLALAAVLGSALLMGQASAMPANGLATVASKVTNGALDVRLVCGPYRCWHRWGWNRWGWNRSGSFRGLYSYAGPGWNRSSYGGGWRRPLYANAGPGWNRWSYGGGYRRPLYAYAGPGLNRWGYGGGWRRPLYAYAGPGSGYGWGWRRPYYAAAGIGLASAAWNAGWYGDPYRNLAWSNGNG